MKFQDFARRDTKSEEVNFDVRRMEKALAAQRFTLPANVQMDEFDEWMRETAKKCRTS
nr:hypothetical protein [uncultured Pseudomonas sp.]